MRSSPSTHRRGLLAGLLMLTASVSGALAIASGGTTPSPAPAAAAAAAAPSAAVVTATGVPGDDGDRDVRGGDGGGRANVAHRTADNGR